MIGNFADEKILMTGGTGFLGGGVLDRLISQGAAPAVLTRRPRTELLWKYKEKIKLIEMDLLDGQALEKFFERFQPDKIIHLAGGANHKNNRADSLEKINFEATARLLDLARAAQVKRIVITGTADEYGFQTCPHSETTPTAPVSDYAISKNKAVKYALSLYEKYHLPVVILRPFTVYGIGQPAPMFVSQAVECAVGNLPFEMSNGMQKRDLVFVTDFADAMIKALTVKNIEGETFNVGSGTAVALRELAEKIWKIAGADSALLKIGARPTGGNELHDTQADISKIKTILGWQPQVSLAEGLKFIIEDRKKSRKKESNER